jgi:glycosyltransferase involved in cell wall biosynthesis
MGLGCFRCAHDGDLPTGDRAEGDAIKAVGISVTLFINGRFLTQPMSGVQRYAHEILRALDKRLASSAALRVLLGSVEVLVPYNVEAPDWQVLRLRVVRGGQGHLWEQTTLLRASRDGVLVGLGNSGPLRHRDHVLCLHDANLFEIPEAFSRQYLLLHRALRPALARRATVLLTVSKTSARALSDHLGVAEDRFHIVPNSAEHVLRLPVENVLARYGLVRGGYLLSVGNQTPNKNLARLIEAHAQCDPSVLPLAVVGGGVPDVEHTAATCGERLYLLGRVPDTDLRALYEGAAGFVFPSLYEGFGIPPLEAMQLGVPVLCARSGAMPEVLGDAPLWFDPRDVGDMTRSLNSFAVMDDALRAALAQAGLRRAELYSWDRSAVLLIEAVQSAMASRVKVNPLRRFVAN